MWGVWWRGHCSLGSGAQATASCSQGKFTEGPRQQVLLDDIRSSGHLLSGILMALWPSQSRKMRGRSWGGGGAGRPRARAEAGCRCAGFQCVVSEINSEMAVTFSLNDSPRKSPRQYNNLVNHLSENFGDHLSEVTPSVLFPPTVARNRGFPLFTAQPVTFCEHRYCEGRGSSCLPGCGLK